MDQRSRQFSKKTAFFVRLGNTSRAIEDDGEIQHYLEQRWPEGGDVRGGGIPSERRSW
jgi:hypothetical protein